MTHFVPKVDWVDRYEPVRTHCSLLVYPSEDKTATSHKVSEVSCLDCIAKILEEVYEASHIHTDD